MALACLEQFNQIFIFLDRKAAKSSISEVCRVNFDCKEEKHGRIYLRSFFVVILEILAVSSRAFLRL